MRSLFARITRFECQYHTTNDKCSTGAGRRVLTKQSRSLNALISARARLLVALEIPCIVGRDCLAAAP